MRRDKLAMDKFECHGWLHITICDDSTIANVKIEHREDHVPYCVVSIPEEIKAMIISQRKEPLTKVLPLFSTYANIYLTPR